MISVVVSRTRTTPPEANPDGWNNTFSVLLCREWEHPRQLEEHFNDFLLAKAGRQDSVSCLVIFVSKFMGQRHQELVGSGLHSQGFEKTLQEPQQGLTKT